MQSGIYVVYVTEINKKNNVCKNLVALLFVIKSTLGVMSRHVDIYSTFRVIMINIMRLLHSN